MHSLDYLLKKFYHRCTAWIIYSIDFITNAQLGLSTPQILSHVYGLDYRLDRFYHKCTALIIDSINFITHVQLGLSTQQILFQM